MLPYMIETVVMSFVIGGILGGLAGAHWVSRSVQLNSSSLLTSRQTNMRDKPPRS